jgi:effector-binding domain-containing protein
MRNLIPIGRFSRVCRLTVKALRHYDEVGLLRPALVDEASGYRYYSLAQAAEAERIRLLRELDMPLDEIREVLRAPDGATVRARLEAQRARLTESMTETRAALALLERMLEPQEETMAYDVQIMKVEELPILGLRERVSMKGFGEAIGRAYGELFGYVGRIGARPAGPPFALYHDEEFKEEDVDVEFCVPIDRRVAGAGRLDGRVLPAGEVAVTLHAGAYEGIGGAYRALAAWIQEHGHETAGPPRETYLCGPPQASSPAEYRTEIAWPIR